MFRLTLYSKGCILSAFNQCLLLIGFLALLVPLGVLSIVYSLCSCNLLSRMDCVNRV